MLTKKQVKQYLKSETTCPYCGGQDITGSSVEVEAGGAYQTITCEECGKSWLDIYKLVDIQEID